MRAVIGLGALALLVVGCQTEVVELLPDAPPPADAAVDVGREARRDLVPDKVQTQDKPPPCVCRFSSCRDTAQCVSLIGAGSVCNGWCSGAKAGSCTSDTDCGTTAEWKCVIDASSQTACSSGGG
jgi:hypothetical protein